MDYRLFTSGNAALLLIGAASGGQLPAPFLPPWLAPGGYVLPDGLAITGLRAVAASRVRHRPGPASGLSQVLPPMTPSPGGAGDGEHTA